MSSPEEPTHGFRSPDEYATTTISDESIEQALRYQHDVGFDEGYEVGYDEGYEFGYNAAFEDGYQAGIDSVDVPDE